jgi:signal transduction histidine kinase
VAPATFPVLDDELLVRLSRAHDFPEALTLLFDAALGSQVGARVLVLLEKGDQLRGVLGIRWNDATVRRIALPLDDRDDPLVAAFHARTTGEIEVPAEREGIAAGTYQVIPVPGGERRPVLGLLVAGPNAALPRDLSPIISHLQRAGPLLDRLEELDELRSSVRQHKQRRDLLTSIIDTLPDPVLITNAENSVLFENRRAELLFNTEEDDSAGRRRAIEINNLLFSSFLTRSTIGGPDANSRELNLVDPSEGGDLLFEVLTTPLPATLVGEKAMVSVLRDVTDLKRATTELENNFKRLRQAEEKSRRERDRLNLILENVGDPILVTDDQSNIILLNREAERLFEVPVGTAAISQRSHDVRANDTKFSSFISEFALSPSATRVAQVNLTEPLSARVFPAEVVSGKVLNERSEMTAIVSVLHDLTKAVENERLAGELSKLNENLENRIRTATEELEERNRQLEWQRQELERAYRLKSQFLASMSHELRTPINALLGYTSLMLDHIYGELNVRQEEALARMYTASQHLLELVNDILDLAKIEAGKMPVHVEPVDLADLIAELAETIEPMMRQKGLEYRVEVDPALPLLETDRTKVKQIILNLLSNAVKFTHEGSISVQARPSEDGRGVIVNVVDTGIGIREEDISKIFDDFRQVDQSSTREYGGTGLGLSITKKLLHLLGGTVRVHSVVGGGSSFSVWLPSRSDEIVLDEEVARVAREANQAVITDD